MKVGKRETHMLITMAFIAGAALSYLYFEIKTGRQLDELKREIRRDREVREPNLWSDQPPIPKSKPIDKPPPWPESRIFDRGPEL